MYIIARKASLETKDYSVLGFAFEFKEAMSKMEKANKMKHGNDFIVLIPKEDRGGQK